MENRDLQGVATATPDNTSRVIDAAHDVADRAKAATSEKIEQGARAASSSLGAISDTMRNAASDLSQDHAWIASALRKTADGVQSASEAVAGGDIERGLQNLSQFAHRQPAIFLGAGFALGFALSRVGKTAIEQAGAGPGVAAPTPKMEF